MCLKSIEFTVIKQIQTKEGDEIFKSNGIIGISPAGYQFLEELYEKNKI